MVVTNVNTLSPHPSNGIGPLWYPQQCPHSIGGGFRVKSQLLPKYRKYLLIISAKWLVVLKKLVFPRVFLGFPSTGTAFSMAFLLGTILTAHVVVLSANAQGPPPGAPASQPDPRLASLADRWVRWIVSIDTSIEPNPFTTSTKGIVAN
jgi:hypothetical protein